MEMIGRLGDLLTLVTFSLSFVLLAAYGVRRARSHTARLAVWLLLAALGVYVVVGISDVLIWAKLSTALETYDDFLEALFPLLCYGIVFATYSAQQYDDALRAQRALVRSHELMMDIVDAAPAGILFLGPSGVPVFANDAAKSVLDLVEDEESGAITGPGWVEDGSDEAVPGQLASLVRDEPYDQMPVTVRWPNGWVVDLLVSGRPLSDARGTVGGVVVSFEKPRNL